MVDTLKTNRGVAALVQAARDGDREAYEQLVRRYEGYVRTVVRSFRLSQADAEDAVQLTWLRLVENLGRLRDPDRLTGWLATTASRECLQIMRRRRQGREVYGADHFFAVRPDERFPSPEANAVSRVMSGVLWAQLAHLPSRGQILLRALTRQDTPAYADVAKDTGIPVGSIGPTRARALLRLRERLEAAGLGAPAWV